MSDDHQIKVWFEKLEPGQRVNAHIVEKTNTMTPRGDIKLSTLGAEPLYVYFVRGGRSDRQLLKSLSPLVKVVADDEDDWDDGWDEDEDGEEYEDDVEFRIRDYVLLIKSSDDDDDDDAEDDDAEDDEEDLDFY